MKHFRTLATLFILFVAVAPLRADDEVRTLDNKTITGKIVSVTEKEVTTATDKGEVVTPIQQVIAIELNAGKARTGVPPGTKYSEVRLIDDTTLLCSKVDLAKDSLQLTLLSGQQAKVRLNDLVSVLHGAQNQNIRKEWDSILAEKNVKRDRVVFLRDEELQAPEGTFGDVNVKAKTIQFRLEGGITRDVSLGDIQGMIFYRPEESTKSPVCQVYDVQGSSLAARKVNLKGNDLLVTTVGGIEITCARELVARFDYNLGKLTFLSDVEPVKVEDARSKVLGRFPAYRVNLNLSDTQIQLDGKPFPKGLSMWAPLELEYNLGGKFKEFKALVGVDPQVGGGSKVRLTIERDGEAVFNKEIVPGAPIPVEFPVTRAKRLRFIVTAEDSLGFSAHVEIAEPRVSQ
jgi:hypothetical protein